MEEHFVKNLKTWKRKMINKYGPPVGPKIAKTSNLQRKGNYSPSVLTEHLLYDQQFSQCCGK